MKKFFSLSICICISLFTFAQPPEGPAKSGMTFGKKTEAKGAITVDKMTSKVSEEPMAVKVKGKVVDVCTKEGCWLKIATADGKMMVKMKDHAFLVPVDINGKEVIVDGIAKMKVTSVKELQHYAEDAGSTQEEIAAIKEPKKEVVLNATGIRVL
jgi:hypothetical protein